jgi:16S rRNA G966 N2-methylase RsmD
MTPHRDAVEARPHTPVYRMHKYFARRPWNVFSDLITRFSSEGEIVLDPFCGGGVTIVEALRLRRKAVGVDVNPIATYVTSMECAHANLSEFSVAFDELGTRVADRLSSFYRTRCDRCRTLGVADWLEWDEKSNRIIRIKLDCRNCGSVEKKAGRSDQLLAEKIERNFETVVKEDILWYPATRIPKGDKTGSLLADNFVRFYELFTKRNLLALAILRKEILESRNVGARELLMHVLSSSLKWSSRLSHLRGKIVEGWAMHAYWIYPKSLEMNVWNVYRRRYEAIQRGKQYSNQHIGPYCKFAGSFNDLVDGKSTCLVLNRSATELPIPSQSIDAVITDPPYGGNVNYAELSDFWYIWMSEGNTIEKKEEAVINRTQEKSIEAYQGLLERVFEECFRVLKDGRPLISTFNSKDFRVVTSFVVAASKAGFTLDPDNVNYQPPIRPYMTTFHAMQIGAFVGDFIFAFKKEPLRVKPILDETDGKTLCERVAHFVDEGLRINRPEPNIREQTYRELIPFLAKYASVYPARCKETADFLEQKIKENDQYLKRTRQRLIENRRRLYRDNQHAR